MARGERVSDPTGDPPSRTATIRSLSRLKKGEQMSKNQYQEGLDIALEILRKNPGRFIAISQLLFEIHRKAGNIISVTTLRVRLKKMNLSDGVLRYRYGEIGFFNKETQLKLSASDQEIERLKEGIELIIRDLKKLIRARS